jgi:hypothetical protein
VTGLGSTVTVRRRSRRSLAGAVALTLCAVLIAQSVPAAAQTAADPSERVALRQLVFSSRDGEPNAVVKVQAMPNMPMMMAPAAGAAEGNMGGGMAMVMTGETFAEMMAGACTAGVFVGGAAAAAAAAPAGPIAPVAIAASAGIGCGFAMAATAAGMGGMMAWRALYTRFK